MNILDLLSAVNPATRYLGQHVPEVPQGLSTLGTLGNAVSLPNVLGPNQAQASQPQGAEQPIPPFMSPNGPGTVGPAVSSYSGPPQATSGFNPTLQPFSNPLPPRRPANLGQTNAGQGYNNFQANAGGIPKPLNQQPQSAPAPSINSALGHGQGNDLISRVLKLFGANQGLGGVIGGIGNGIGHLGQDIGHGLDSIFGVNHAQAAPQVDPRQLQASAAPQPPAQLPVSPPLPPRRPDGLGDDTSFPGGSLDHGILGFFNGGGA